MTDELWPGGPKFLRSSAAFPIGTDAVLLADFADVSNASLACDLGCGSGIISVLFAMKNRSLVIDGLEIQPKAAKIAKLNAEMCGMASNIRITCGDLRECRDFFDSGDYDVVVSNPPYFAEGRGKAADTEELATARDERSCSIADVCAAASYLTRWGGKFALCHRPERLSEVFAALCSNGFEPKRMRFVQHRVDAAPNIVLIEARRGGKPGLTIEAPLIMTKSDGSDSDEIIRIYHREAK